MMALTLNANASDETRCHPLASGNAAVNAGSLASCTDTDASPLTVGQINGTRPVGAACDIGAFELP